MLTVIDAYKRFGANEALTGVSVDFESSAITALIGPSGCGKSTLLRLLIGLLWPDRGTIRIRGEQLTPSSVREVRHRTGYMIQDGGLFPHLTCRNNVALQARFLRWDEARIEKRIEELAALVHLGDAPLDRYPTQLSGGQRQRVSLMRALMLDPDIVLLDEPLGALDPLIRRELQEELRETFRNLRKTVVLVTHDLNEAAYLCDRLVLMRSGKIVQQGSVDALVHQPADAFVSNFVNAYRGRREDLR